MARDKYYSEISEYYGWDMEDEFEREPEEDEKDPDDPDNCKNCDFKNTCEHSKD